MAASLQDPFLLQREIQQLEQNDEQRKNLIKLSILKIFYQSKSNNKAPSHTIDNSNSASASRIAELTKKNHDYELTINKLKQLHTTKEKLQESKLESLRDEIGKLKQQLKDQTRNKLQVPTLSQFQPTLEPSSSRPSSAFSTSPYVNKIMFNQGSGGLAKNYLSPTVNSINKSIFASDSKSSILSPIQHKRKVLVPTKAKREYTNYNSMKKQFEQNGNLPQKESTVEPETPNKRITRAASKKSSSPVTTPTRHSSNNTNRSSPSVQTADLTPSRLPNNGELFDDKMRSLDDVINKSFTSANASEAENDAPDANSTTIESISSRTTGRGTHMSEDETFASANSSLAKSSEKKDKKKKKLRLWKSEVSKVSISSPNDKTSKNRNKGLHLEDEGLNTLNYYQDENFLNDNNDTPKMSRKRKNDESETTPLTFKKKKKNVFKID
ncbi:uncharacterized protein AC631_00753 [Debaryomyces fabryi]|uniref:Uncharacterized protein n=1 Tax=Debaryomyces fabryi TaxID=58627 RepID=A0A0V1Q4M8_9ASCO|nr:uncharacterized protein AC631_00753 [Debaryomyces fabryi]KSA03437.1 hypothetical protein AC631_00753 [Debaryomyces fabryi]CUM53707.1 unnamed protein product [Debaryomyces fabryi]